jgi:cystathionine gamma-synthase
MALEHAEDCLLSSSGMCSATTMLLALVPAGGHIVTTTDCYRRTRQFIQTVRPRPAPHWSQGSGFTQG